MTWEVKLPPKRLSTGRAPDPTRPSCMIMPWLDRDRGSPYVSRLAQSGPVEAPLVQCATSRAAESAVGYTAASSRAPLDDSPPMLSPAPGTGVESGPITALPGDWDSDSAWPSW